MHLVDQRALGIVMLLLLGLLVAVKRAATGSILDKPGGRLLVQLVNVYNLFFLLVVNPLVAILLIFRRIDLINPTRVGIEVPWLLATVEVVGLALYVLGFLLMAWALFFLAANYQLGGSTPRPGDAMVADGPYGLTRHPMYTAALCISLGLACLLQSWALAGVFCVYLVLILLLVPVEEDGLRQAYGEQYAAYQRKVRRLFPVVY